MNKKIGKAIRPIFIPKIEGIGVTEINIEFDWHLGMSPEVRKRSVKSLHEVATDKYKFKKILEASSKSEQDIGIKLSAFYLKNINGYSVENLYQSCKVFSGGGPYRDLLVKTPKEAKIDERLKNSGEIKNFEFNKKKYPTEPKSLFYDWLYLQVLFSQRNDQLRDSFFNEDYNAFSDIEFNPKKSFSCQARTLALCISLFKNKKYIEFIENPVNFSNVNKLYENTSHQIDLF